MQLQLYLLQKCRTIGLMELVIALCSEHAHNYRIAKEQTLMTNMWAAAKKDKRKQLKTRVLEEHMYPVHTLMAAINLCHVDGM